MRHHCARAAASLNVSLPCAPRPQCSYHCRSCNSAGAGKCDQCGFKYGLTASRTCGPVRAPARCAGSAACPCMLHHCARALRRVSPGLPSAPWTAVCSPLQVLRHRRGRQVRSMSRSIRPDCKRHVRSGERACCQSMGAAACTRAPLRACWSEPHKAFLVHVCSLQCAAHCKSCDIAGAGRCQECGMGYGLTANYTCAPVCVPAAIARVGAAACKHLQCFITVPARCGGSHQACHLLPGPQCAPHCSSCTLAGAGKCDDCDDGYGVTASGTCGPVRACLLPKLGRCPASTCMPHHCARAESHQAFLVCSPDRSALPTAARATLQVSASAINAAKGTL